MEENLKELFNSKISEENNNLNKNSINNSN